MKWIIVFGILIVGAFAYWKYLGSPNSENKRNMYAWAGAFWGALIGSFFGVAGFGSAIAGTIPGALIGYLVVPLLLINTKADQTFEQSYENNTDTIISDDSDSHALSDDYHKLVQHLQFSLDHDYIHSVSGYQVDQLDTYFERADHNVEEIMNWELTWWYESEPGWPKNWYVYLKNHAELDINVICLNITPGPSKAPTGPTNRVYIKLQTPVPPGLAFITIFTTPIGSRDDLEIQDCSLHSVYLLPR